MKKPSKDLFELIKSLNPQEIKHYRQQLRTLESNTIIFFDHLISAEDYDENLIRKTVLADLNANQFSVAKHYLYNSILTFLLQRDQQAHAVWKLNTRMQMLEILYQKELFEQCKKLLTSIERAAKQLDDPSVLKDVFLWKLKVADRQNHAVSEAEFLEFGNAFLDYSEKENQLSHQLWQYQNFFFNLRKNGVLRSESVLSEEYKSFFEGNEALNPDAKTSFAGQLAIQHASATYQFLTGKAEKAYEGHLWIVNGMEERPGWIALRPDIYLDAVFRIGVLESGSCNFDEVEKCLEKLESLKSRQGIQEGRLFFFKTQLERLVHLLQKDWELMAEMVARFEAEQSKLRIQLSRAEHLTFNFNNAMALFSYGDFLGSRRRLIELQNLPAVKENLDFDIITKFLLLLIAERVRDADSFKILHRNLNRMLKKNIGSFPLEAILLMELPKIFKAKTQTKKTQTWKVLEEKLEMGKLQFSRAIQYFDFISWVKSKANGLPFEVVFKEKVRNYCLDLRKAKSK